MATAILGPSSIKRILDPHKYKVAAEWNSPISSTALSSLSKMPTISKLAELFYDSAQGLIRNATYVHVLSHSKVALST